MKTSVVLSAYNGELFVLEQLESIQNQTVPVDEVLILDDCSTDRTFAICEKFIKENKLFPTWQLERNEKNVGFKQNFYNGFLRATGDVIFICDQDDRWRPNKVEKIKYYFEQYPNTLSICSAFSRFWGSKILDKHVAVPNRKRNGVRKILFEDFMLFYSYLGMTTSFRKELLCLHYKESFALLPYDVAVNFVASINDQLLYVDEVLVDRRSYSTSVSHEVAKEWCNREFGGNVRLYQIYRDNLALEGFVKVISEYYSIYNKRYRKRLQRRIFLNKRRYSVIQKFSWYGWFLLLRQVRSFKEMKKCLYDLRYVRKR